MRNYVMSYNENDLETMELVSDPKARKLGRNLSNSTARSRGMATAGKLCVISFVTVMVVMLVLALESLLQDTESHLAATNTSSFSLVQAYRARQSAPISDRISKTTSIRTIKILGERNSGTNFLEKILVPAFHPHYSNNNGSFPFSEGSFGPFGGKHMFRHKLLSREELELLAGPEYQDVLWLLAVRSPCDWGTGMYHKPWHMCPPKDWLDSNRNGTQPATEGWRQKCKSGEKHTPIGSVKKELDNYDISRYDFWGMPWIDYQEAKNSEDFSYDNIFHLRNFKEQLMLQLMTAVPDRVRIVHLKLYERNPKQLVEDLVSEYDLTINANATLITKGRPHKTDCLTKEERDLAEARIDWEIESAFGFVPGDCRICKKNSSNEY